MKVWGQIERAQLENLSSDPSTTALVGRVWYNTTANRIKCVDNATTVQTLLFSGLVVNADINAAAAIAYSKLNLTGSIVNADINAAAAIADSKLAVSYIKADGSRALTANWAAGAFSATHNSVVVGSAANTISGLFNIDTGSAAALAFKINATTTLNISSGGAITLGASAGTQTHIVNGSTLKGNAGGSTAFVINVSDTLSTLRLSGDLGTGVGGEIILFGSASGAPSQIRFVADGTLNGFITNTGIWTIGASSGTQSHVINGGFATAGGNCAIAGTISANNVLRVGNTNPLSGTTQNGIVSAVTATSAATTQSIGFLSNMTTAASAFTQTNRYGFYHQNLTKGAGSTITYDIGYFIEMPTQGGTGNAAIADANPTGNFFIYSTSANASLLTGPLTAASFIPTSSSVPANGMYLSAANTISFATNSTKQMTINSTGDVDFAPTNAVYSGQAQAGTAVTNSTFPIMVGNSNATTNNWASYGFTDGSSHSGFLNGFIACQFTDRTNHYGAISIVTRGASGFVQGLIVTPTGTQVQGTNTNDNATAGYTGEYFETKIAYGTYVTGSGVLVAEGNIALTSGDWDVGVFGVASSSVANALSMFIVGIDTSSIGANISLGGAGTGDFQATSQAAATVVTLSVPNCRKSIASNTTFYFIVAITFSSGTIGFGGRIWARRRR